ncbi:MAG: hypothetical protein KME29_31330 [Calothrix sp. FI2-JRJ7]|nr:hypothetical protein [Calothrix sp. FI2-JRJ7]
MKTFSRIFGYSAICLSGTPTMSYKAISLFCAVFTSISNRIEPPAMTYKAIFFIRAVFAPSN